MFLNDFTSFSVLLVLPISITIFFVHGFDATSSITHQVLYRSFDYSCAGLCNHVRDIPWEDIFEIDASAGGTNFVSGSRLKLMRIFHIKHIRSNFIHLNGFQLIELLP